MNVADTFRAAAVAAGFDLVALGVRPEGPLDWTPEDPPPVEPPVAIARRRVLTRRRLDAIERQRRRDRMYAQAFAREVS